MIKKDYSGCTHPNCTECKCKDCIVDHEREFKDLEEFRREQCNVQSAHTKNVNNNERLKTDNELAEKKRQYQ